MEGLRLFSRHVAVIEPLVIPLLFSSHPFYSAMSCCVISWHHVLCVMSCPLTSCLTSHVVERAVPERRGPLLGVAAVHIRRNSSR